MYCCDSIPQIIFTPFVQLCKDNEKMSHNLSLKKNTMGLALITEYIEDLLVLKL